MAKQNEVVYCPTPENPLLVATVWHTGTTFVISKTAPCNATGIREFRHGVDSLAMQHVESRNMQDILEWPHDIVTTYRDVIETRESWLSRGLPLTEFFEQWRNWFTLMEQRKPMVIDITHREPKTIKNWTRVNSHRSQSWHK